MYVDLTTNQKDVSVIQLTYDQSQDLEVPMNPIQETDVIQTEQQELEFAGSDSSKLFFNLKNKETGKVEKLDFSLKYWASFVNYYG